MSEWITEQVKSPSVYTYQSEHIRTDMAMFDTTSQKETGSDKPWNLLIILILSCDLATKEL